MNKKYLFKIPVKIKAGEELTKIDLVVNTLLSPMYVTESELLSMFVDEDEYDKYYLKAREIAFTSSIRAEEYLKSRLKLLNLPPEHVLLFKRELSQCFSVNTLANFFFRDAQEQVSRSKTLGEFSVSTTVKNNPYALRQIIDSSKDCIKEAKKAIDEMTALSGAGLAATFNKGKLNISNKFAYRAWFHNNLPDRSRQIFASEKVVHPNGNVYKDGFARNVGGYLPNVPESRTYYPHRTT